jgi:DNA-binding MarR family transcriptional regulator
MKPVDIRNECWSDIEARLTEDRMQVYLRLTRMGEGTTRELAEYMALRVEDVRPRVTELFQLGFVHLVRKSGHEGVYCTVPFQAAKAKFEELKAAGDQMLLAI